MPLPDTVQKTPLEQLREMNEQVGKSRKKSARARRKTGQSVEKFYRKQLQSLVSAIQNEIENEVIPVVKQEKQEYLQDADPQYTRDNWADRLIQVIRAIAERWTSSAMKSEYERIAKRTVSMAEAESTKDFLKSVNEATGVDMSSMMTQEGIEDYVEAANYQNAQLIRTVPQEFLTRVENSVLGGIRDGDAPSKIAKNIRESTNVTKNQAKRIARDQTTKLTSEITERRQRQSGVKYYQVITAGDNRVTGKPGGKYPNAKISCWGIANQDIGYGPGVYRWDQGAKWNGVSGLHPGRHHVQCFPAGTEVAASEIEASSVRRFKGDMVTIFTASGKKLTATPNHPILTAHGWIPAGELNESHYVISVAGRESLVVVEPSDYDVVSSIEECAHSVGMDSGMIPVKVETASPDFHGDGTESEVSILRFNGGLNTAFISSFFQSVKKVSFIAAFKRVFILLALRVGYLFKSRFAATARSRMGFFSLPAPLKLRHLRPFNKLGFRLSANRDAVLGENTTYYVSRNAKSFCHGIFREAGFISINDITFGQIKSGGTLNNDTTLVKNALNNLGSDRKLARNIVESAPAGVFLDNVTGVSVNRSVVCHVYNLQTKTGLYAAEGILSHNCRCTAKPIFEWELPKK